MKSLLAPIYARYRAFSWLSCLESPRPDVLQGFRKWAWLAGLRARGLLVDPSVQVRSEQNAHRDIRWGASVAVDHGAILWLGRTGDRPGVMEFGDRVYIGPYCYLGSAHRLTLGASTLIGAFSYLITVNHGRSDPALPYLDQDYTGADISLGRNVWLGCHVVVLPGVTIGDHAVVGAGSVVTRSVPAGEVWAGVPARPLRSGSSPPA